MVTVFCYMFDSQSVYYQYELVYAYEIAYYASQKSNYHAIMLKLCLEC